MPPRPVNDFPCALFRISRDKEVELQKKEIADVVRSRIAVEKNIKAFLETGQKGMRVNHLLAACVDEFSENEDLPNTTNPDDWARISGKKGERIVYIRTLVSGKTGTEAGRSIDTVANTGQYL